MAEITLTSNSICMPHRSPWGAFPERSMGVSTGVSSATIHIGRLVTLDWSGSTTVGRVKASTADNFFFGVGIANSLMSGSTAVTGVRGAASEVTVWEANPMVEFRAFTKGAALASSHVGLRKTLHWDSTLNISYVDLTASTASDWRVIVTDLIDNENDTGGRVAFRFVSHLTENNGSSVAVTSTSPVLAFFG